MVREGLKPPFLRLGLALVCLAGLLACANLRSPTRIPPPNEPPAAPREFRAAWVATVANIDWPSARGLPVATQQREARELIARARSLGLNALILQVRPMADALYASNLEPWSEYLTGEQGKPPGYDPLAFWIEEAHRAGLQLHAWFNPYRARHATAQSPLAASHVGNSRPALVRTYGDQLWLDPGEPRAEEHVLAVLLDVVRRYDVDGVHIDDYFYPYPVKDAADLKLDFPDDPPWQTYLAGGGTLARADWRRRNVDRFIERLYRQVHLAKPHVQVGVSPFGIGRPDRRPPGIAGFSQYDELYTDVERWLEQGWLDYLAPQLYWKRDSPGQPFAPLLDYWRAQNPKGRHVWPGLFTSRTGPPELWPPAEISAQIQATRERGGATGHIHFSMVALKKDFGGVATEVAGSYRGPALVPAAPWLPGAVPPAPQVRLRRQAADNAHLLVEVSAGDPSCLLALWGRYGANWRLFTLPGGGGTLPARLDGQPLDLAFASSVGRTGRESPRVALGDAR